MIHVIRLLHPFSVTYGKSGIELCALIVLYVS